MTAETTQPGLGKQIRGRVKAALIHASISLIVFVPLAALVLRVWYPDVYFEADGGWRGMLIIFCVDVVLGPTLTLIIFSPGKPRSKILLDLSVIGVIQIGALAWGIYAVHSQRPVAAVLWEGSFRPIVAEALHIQGASPDLLAELSPHTPPTIYVQPPMNRDEMAMAFLETMNSDLNMHEIVSRYEPLAAGADELAAASIGWDVLVEAEPALEPELTAIAADRSSQSLLIVPFRGRYADAVLVFSADLAFLGGVVTTQAY